MKKWTFLLLGLALALSACQEDENFDLENTLHYDGPNNTAPFLPGGEYEAAARFTSVEQADYVGGKLLEVSFFIADLPQSCIVKIYGEGTADTPGNLLHSVSMSGKLNPFSWNSYELSNPIDITGKDLWVSISFTHSASQQTIGCDAGPAAPDGDWLYQNDDQDWLSFRQRTGESINWNIRARVSEN